MPSRQLLAVFASFYFGMYVKQLSQIGRVKHRSPVRLPGRVQPTEYQQLIALDSASPLVALHHSNYNWPAPAHESRSRLVARKLTAKALAQMQRLRDRHTGLRDRSPQRTSGYPGMAWDKETQSWRVRVFHEGRFLERSFPVEKDGSVAEALFMAIQGKKSISVDSTKSFCAAAKVSESDIIISDVIDCPSLDSN